MTPTISAAATPATIPVLSFDRTCEYIARMSEPLQRQRVGAMEIITGRIEERGLASVVALAVDSLSGSSVVVRWSAA